MFERLGGDKKQFIKLFQETRAGKRRSKLLKNPTLKDNVSYMCDRFLGMGPSGDWLWSIGFVVVYRITYLAGRSAVGTTSQFRRDSNHGRTRKSELRGGLNSAWLVWPNRGGSEAIPRRI